MRFVLINTLMLSSRRLQHRLLSSLQPPSADLPLPRKDHTGFILTLLCITLGIAFYLMS